MPAAYLQAWELLQGGKEGPAQRCTNKTHPVAGNAAKVKARDLV
jgi:hypothetical protein